MSYKENLIAKISEISEKRTHCQCSYQKVVEKKSFDQIIAKIEGIDDVTREKVIEKLTVDFPDTRSGKIQATAYAYAREIAKRVQ